MYAVWTAVEPRTEQLPVLYSGRLHELPNRPEGQRRDRLSTPLRVLLPLHFVRPGNCQAGQVRVGRGAYLRHLHGIAPSAHALDLARAFAHPRRVRCLQGYYGLRCPLSMLQLSVQGPRIFCMRLGSPRISYSIEVSRVSLRREMRRQTRPDELFARMIKWPVSIQAVRSTR